MSTLLPTPKKAITQELATQELAPGDPRAAAAEFQEEIWACKRYQSLRFEMADGTPARFQNGRVVCKTAAEAAEMQLAMDNLARTSPLTRLEIVKVNRAGAERIAKEILAAKQTFGSQGMHSGSMQASRAGLASLINEASQANGAGSPFVKAAIADLNSSSTPAEADGPAVQE